MLLFSLQINFEKSELPRNLHRNITRILDEAFPDCCKNVAGTVVTGTNILWQGSTNKAMLVQIQTVQNLNKISNEKFIRMISKYLSEATGVSMNRIYISLIEKVPSDVAVNDSLLW